MIYDYELKFKQDFQQGREIYIYLKILLRCYIMKFCEMLFKILFCDFHEKTLVGITCIEFNLVKKNIIEYCI